MAIMGMPSQGIMSILLIIIVIAGYLIINKIFARKADNNSIEPSIPAAVTVVQPTTTASVITAVIAAAVAEYQKNEEGVKNA